jgi:Carboxylesterase.
MSGAVLNPWALVEEPRERSFRLGAVLGCKTTDSKELVEFMRTVPARRLIEDTVKAQTPEVSPLKITDTDLQVARPWLLKVKCITLWSLGN